MDEIFYYDIKLVKNNKFKIKNTQINNSTDAYYLLKPFFENLDKEKFIILMLDSRRKSIGISTISIGIVNSVLIHPREVFKSAILANATAIILAHNHLFDNCSPSEDDIASTRNIIKAGTILGIDVFDHLILTDNNYFSFQDEKLEL